MPAPIQYKYGFGHRVSPGNRGLQTIGQLKITGSLKAIGLQNAVRASQVRLLTRTSAQSFNWHVTTAAIMFTLTSSAGTAQPASSPW